MNNIRIVFGAFFALMLFIFWIAAISLMFQNPNDSLVVWAFIISVPLYGLFEGFAYIVRVGGRNE